MTRPLPHRVGIYLALVQFLFAATWIVYVAFLPRLVAQAGLPLSAVLPILITDQLVFMVMDFTTGLFADRVVRQPGRLSRLILGVTLVSCLAFLLLPFLAPLGGVPLLLLTLVWALSSSVLRAPPLMLLGKYLKQPALPWLASLSLFGLGLAGAVSPYLGSVLKNADPRWPFVLSSLALAAAALGMVWAERALVGNAADAAALPAQSAAESAPATATATPPSVTSTRALPVFLFAVLLLAIGHQVHVFLNSAPLYLRHAAAPELDNLLPIFWIGFNLLMLPATLATRRYGGLLVMVVAGVVAALAGAVASQASSLGLLAAMQFLAGGAWGSIMMSAVTTALVLGQGGWQGRITGAVASLLSLAAFARMSVVATGQHKDPQTQVLLQGLPVAFWGLAALLLGGLWLAQRSKLRQPV